MTLIMQDGGGSRGPIPASFTRAIYIGRNNFVSRWGLGTIETEGRMANFNDSFAAMLDHQGSADG